jgi:hypothetical protein
MSEPSDRDDRPPPNWPRVYVMRTTVGARASVMHLWKRLGTAGFQSGVDQMWISPP